jgi:Tfp pilus assembly protein PilV
MARLAYPPARPRMPRRRSRLAAEDGGLIIEVIVSALLVGMLAVGIFSALDAASARTGAIKSRAIAANVAQADLERLRAMSLEDVSNRRDIYIKTLDGIPFTVTSRADWVTDSSGSASCSSASSAKADYLKISATVSWPAMGGLKPVALTSVIAPPTGSFASNEGSLAVKVADAAGNPVVGKTVTLAGPAGFTEVTNDLGCVLWGFLTAGNYTVTLGGGCADHAGTDPVTQAVSVVGGATNVISLDCDTPGTISAVGDTVTRNLTGTLQAAKASPLRYLSVTHSGMPATKVFGNGTPVGTITSSSLFPFTDPYAVYAGNCASQDPRTSPNTGTAILQNAPQGGTVGPVTVRQPSINVDVDRADTSAQLSGVPVTATIDATLTPGCGGMFTFTTNANGQIDDPGVPYGTYDLCGQWTNAGVTRRVRIADVANTTANGTALTRISIPATGGTVGSCP